MTQIRQSGLAQDCPQPRCLGFPEFGRFTYAVSRHKAQSIAFRKPLLYPLSYERIALDDCKSLCPLADDLSPSDMLPREGERKKRAPGAGGPLIT